MSNIKVVDFDHKNQDAERDKKEMIGMLEAMIEQVKDGTIQEIVAVSLTDNTEIQTHVYTFNVPTAIGLFEMGKSFYMIDHM